MLTVAGCVWATEFEIGTSVVSLWAQGERVPFSTEKDEGRQVGEDETALKNVSIGIYRKEIHPTFHLLFRLSACYCLSLRRVERIAKEASDENQAFK